MRKSRKIRRIITRIVLVLVVLAVTAALFLWPSKEQLRQDYIIVYPEQWQSVSAADWMAQVDGSTPLNALTLPGSHDSASQFVLLPLLGRCQEVGLGEQLNMGVRFLDLRLQTKRQPDGSIQVLLCHGPLPCMSEGNPFAAQASFQEALRDCNAFLSKHPDEAVLLCLKHETGDCTDEELEREISAFREAAGERWCDYDGTQTLDELRGKLVVLRRYNAAGTVCFDWTDQGGAQVKSPAWEQSALENGISLQVQDRYEYTQQDKWVAFRALLDEPLPENTLRLNYLSVKGDSALGVPQKFAKALNAKLAALTFDSDEDIEDGEAEHNGDGILILDFVTEGLARLIFARNPIAE